MTNPIPFDVFPDTDVCPNCGGSVVQKHGIANSFETNWLWECNRCDWDTWTSSRKPKALPDILVIRETA